MKQPDSQEFLAEYVRNGSERAFRELVSRYLDLVYSTALRCVQGDTHKAQDVAQTVFVDLARLASRLSKDAMLGGWLHRHTCFVASTLLRGERRRLVRERQAAEMNSLLNSTDSGLAHLAPVLDAAINELDDEDRKAILLRFYERLDLRSVGEALGSSENAAQKRVSRALDQLHLILTRQGVSISVVALTAVLAGEAVTAAPAGLAASIVSTAIAGAAVGTGISVTLFKLSALTKLKIGLLAAAALGVATTLWLEHRAELELRSENELLQRQLAQRQTAQVQTEPQPQFVQNPARPPASRPQPSLNAEVAKQDGLYRNDTQTTPGAAPTVSTTPVALGALLYTRTNQRTRFYAASGSRMRIEGHSSIHDWQLESTMIGGHLEAGTNFPIEAGQSLKPGPADAEAESFIMTRSLKSIDTDGRPYSDRMDELIYESLKAQQNPRISFFLTELALTQPAKGKEQPYLADGKGQLVIAGVTNSVSIPVSILPLRDKKLKISGNLPIKMSDFEIPTPTYSGAFGHIEVAEEVKLSFEWSLSQRNPGSIH